MNHLGPALPGRAALLVGLLANQRRGTVRLRPDVPTTRRRRRSSTSAGSATPTTVPARRRGDDGRGRSSPTPPFADIVDDVEVVDGFGGYAHATSTCPWARWSTTTVPSCGYDDLFVADARCSPTSRRRAPTSPCSSPSASPSRR